MNQTTFNRLVSAISSRLKIMSELGVPITNELIGEKIDDISNEFSSSFPHFRFSDVDKKRLKFHIGSLFNVRVGEPAISLRNRELPRWLDSRRSEISWDNWEAYRSMLEGQGRAEEIIVANEEVVDNVLDYSGDPSTPGVWARKGLVMGNVQSGKTQNYLGLINKAISAGYKTIILLGGHLNDLRKQTQERVDEGVLGRRSKHLADMSQTEPAPIGVGLYSENNVNTGTTTVGDFNKNFADRLGFKLTGEDPVIFTIKKNTSVMERLYDWIKDYHYLNPDADKRLEGPLLLIDDEADYASINTKHHKEEVTKTNDMIRRLLSLYSRSTYVGYTATPFANIFIDPDDSSFSNEDDLFPSDFMIKMPVPDNYCGQEFFFGSGKVDELEDEVSTEDYNTPTIAIDDYGPVYSLKAEDVILELPDSLKEAVLVFVLVIGIRSLRGDRFSHNTMLVNISHLQVHQNRLEALIEDYRQELENSLASFAGLGVEGARSVTILRALEETFYRVFSVEEEYGQIFCELVDTCRKIKVWAINQSAASASGRELNYSVHEEHGLCAIVIGGHKLSRGLTLEGLSISYFARNSKAYDTLMQMCRWFGYRPGYADLCRVYLPQQSIDWYTFISSAIRELYQELDLMSRKEQRPKDFGLKVREHPGSMIVTAKNKLGWAESDVHSQDLWGQVQRRFRFQQNPDPNDRNLEYTRKFIEHLSIQRKGTENLGYHAESGALILSGVKYNDLIEFIERIDLPEDDLGNQALIRHLEKMEKAELGLPKVILFNQAGSRKVKWEKGLTEEDRSFINSKYEFIDGTQITLAKRRMLRDKENGTLKVTSVHLGNPDDEKLFLSESEQKRVADESTNAPVSFNYICSEDRDYPGLLIYLFAVAVEKGRSNDDQSPSMELAHGSRPTLGYTISLPRSDNLKGKSKKEIQQIIRETKHSYQVGKVYRRNQELGAYEDIEYED